MSGHRHTKQKSYYYWDQDFKNAESRTLQECIDNFGTVITRTKTYYYKVIFLDERKNLDNSWMLWAKDSKTHQNVKVTYYEKNSKNIVIGDI